MSGEEQGKPTQKVAYQLLKTLWAVSGRHLENAGTACAVSCGGEPTKTRREQNDQYIVVIRV